MNKIIDRNSECVQLNLSNNNIKLTHEHVELPDTGCNDELGRIITNLIGHNLTVRCRLKDRPPKKNKNKNRYQHIVLASNDA